MRLIVTITPRIDGGWAVCLEQQDLWTDEIISAHGRMFEDHMALWLWLENEFGDYQKVQDLCRRAGVT